MFKVFIRTSFVGLIAFLFAIQASAQASQDKNNRQFDFWIGEWDVNVRALKDDKSWEDSHQAVARIYSLLGGKAILELWSEKEGGINGYSLRYFNPNTQRWDLWLNWPGKNRSGTSVLVGSFRHGRGEFVSQRKIDEKTNQITRFTFSDVSEDSLRWDDGFSRDGGKTWLSHWIMEFTRRSQTAPALGAEKNLHTFYSGTTCDQPEFQILKKLTAEQTNSGKFSLFNVLDGCMIMGIANTVESSVFFTLTYNTYAKSYEFTFLDDREDSPLSVYYGPATPTGFELKKLRKEDEESTALIEFDGKINSIKLNYRGKNYSISQ